MFHSDYSYIDDLPISLINRAYRRLLNHSRNPIPLELISEKNERIERYLQHTLDNYEKSLNRKRKTMGQKRPRSWPECNSSPALPATYVTDNVTKSDSITCD